VKTVFRTKYFGCLWSLSQVIIFKISINIRFYDTYIDLFEEEHF
jgi:hypothetical protein